MAPKGSGGKEKGAQNTNISADAKIHYDEATGHLKMGNYTKALSGYNLVSAECGCEELHSADNFFKNLTANQLIKELPKVYYRV